MKPITIALAAALALTAALLVNPARGTDEIPAGDAHTGVTWHKDYAKAQKLAKEQGKSLVINFTGSDWCGWCIRLEEEVFGKEEFAKVAEEKYVFVFLDFPRGEEPKKAIVDPALNARFKSEFQIKGYPTIALTTADGHPYARTGYQKGGPTAYIKHLEELERKAEPLMTLVADEAKLADSDALKSALPVLTEGGFLTHPKYAAVLAAMKKVDADGSLGLRGKAEEAEEARKSAKATADFDAFIIAMGREPDWNAIYDYLEKHQGIRGNNYINVTFGAAEHFTKQGEKEKARTLFTRLLEDEDVKRTPQAVETIKQRLKSLDSDA